MRSTGISAFAYPRLRAALGLPPRPPRLHDTGQMLALPDLDVLDALGCDVIHVTMDECTNAFEEPARWKPYGFGGRLDALVPDPGIFRSLPDGTIERNGGTSRMPPASYVFDEEHGGQRLDVDAELREPDFTALERDLRREEYAEERVRAVAAYCRRVRDASDRAVFFNGLPGTLGFPGGMAEFSMVCLLHPEWVRELHRIRIDHAIRQATLLLPEIRDCVDVLIIAADDQGTQNGPILPPPVFAALYVPAYRRLTDAVHRIAPEARLFLHSCGAIYDIIPQVIEAGFDILNPVQWPAGGHSPAEWKAAGRGKLSLWGGGVNTQRTLPLGTVAEVAAETKATVRVLAKGGGYVFTAIHNILAEIDPKKVIAMYRAAGGAD